MHTPTIAPELGQSDFGPYSVEIEYRNGLNVVSDYADDPAAARFPYAYDRASRVFNLARRDPSVSWVTAHGPAGMIDSRNLTS